MFINNPFNYVSLTQNPPYQIFPLRSANEKYIFRFPWLAENRRVQVMFYQTVSKGGQDFIMAMHVTLILTSDIAAIVFLLRL